MATAESIAIRIEAALKQFSRAAEIIAAYTGVSAPELPTWNRSPEELRAEQLETVAAWADEMAQYAQGQTIKLPEGAAEIDAPDYAELTRDQLEALIAERGIDMSGVSGSGANGSIIKHDLVMVLEANDTIPKEGDAP